jgi:hypothetical protein
MGAELQDGAVRIRRKEYGRTAPAHPPRARACVDHFSAGDDAVLFPFPFPPPLFLLNLFN